MATTRTIVIQMNEKVICKECQCLKQKSIVYLRTKTMPQPRSVFYDELGGKHIHDETVVLIFYTCSKGHDWDNANYGNCINEKCDWNGESVTIKN